MSSRPSSIIVFSAAVLGAGLPCQASSAVSMKTTDAGGGRVRSGSYTIDSAIGATGSLSTAGSNANHITARSGFVGQLYDVTALALSAATEPPAVDGGDGLQLGAWEVLDDASFLRVPASGVTWSVGSGPISQITSGGVAFGQPVNADTSALVQAAFDGFTATASVLVRARGTLPLGDITADAASLRGRIDPGGLATTVFFEYGLDTGYGQTTAPQSLGQGTGSVPFTAHLTELAPGASYHYRLVVTRGGVTTRYADQTFTTVLAVPALPGVARWILLASLFLLLARFLGPLPANQRPRVQPE